MDALYAKTISLLNIFVKKAQEATAIVDFEPVQISDSAPESVEQSRTFNIEALRGMNSDDAITSYIESTLQPIGDGKGAGVGSGRRVYDLGDGKVLKHGFNRSGVYQNYEEARISNRNPVFADVYDLGPEAKWIVSEKIQGFSDPEDFRIRTGIPVEAIQTSGKVKQFDDDMAGHLRSRYDLEEDAIDFIRNLHKINADYGTILGDLLNYQHWGVASSGQVKLYDYGLDSEGYAKMYQNGILKDNQESEEAELNQMMDEFEASNTHKNLGVIEMPITK
jgi:hypothetical protein